MPVDVDLALRHVQTEVVRVSDRAQALRALAQDLGGNAALEQAGTAKATAFFDQENLAARARKRHRRRRAAGTSANHQDIKGFHRTSPQPEPAKWLPGMLRIDPGQRLFQVQNCPTTSHTSLTAMSTRTTA